MDASAKPSRKSLAFYDRFNKTVEFIGNVDSDGWAVGNFWISASYSDVSPFTNGFFYGPMDPEGTMTGSNAAFVYPDMNTVVVGDFKGTKMESARQSVISAERCQGGIKILRVQEKLTMSGRNTPN